MPTIDIPYPINQRLYFIGDDVDQADEDEDGNPLPNWTIIESFVRGYLFSDEIGVVSSMMTEHPLSDCFERLEDARAECMARNGSDSEPPFYPFEG